MSTHARGNGTEQCRQPGKAHTVHSFPKFSAVTSSSVISASRRVLEGAIKVRKREWVSERELVRERARVGSASSKLQVESKQSVRLCL